MEINMQKFPRLHTNKNVYAYIYQNRLYRFSKIVMVQI